MHCQERVKDTLFVKINPIILIHNEIKHKYTQKIRIIFDLVINGQNIPYLRECVKFIEFTFYGNEY